MIADCGFLNLNRQSEIAKRGELKLEYIRNPQSAIRNPQSAIK